jgi:hypothetical protein
MTLFDQFLNLWEKVFNFFSAQSRLIIESKFISKSSSLIPFFFGTVKKIDSGGSPLKQWFSTLGARRPTKD